MAKNPFDKRNGKKVKVATSSSALNHSLDHLFEKFFHAKSAEGLSEKTMLSYKENYAYFTEFLDVKKIIRDVRNITPDVMRSYISWMLREKIRFEGNKFKSEKEKTIGLSPTTANTRVKILRTMFRFLMQEEMILSNPLLNVRKIEEPENEIKILSVEQLQTLINTPDRRTYSGFRDYVVMNYLLDGFFRITEGLSLKVDDIDFDNGMVNISAEIAKGKRSRVVPLQKHTMKLLKELIKENEEFNSDFVFLANYGEPLTPSHFRHRLSGYVKKAKLKCRVHPHLFRHTAATIFLENGGDLRHLQLYLGHRDLRMVIRYTHLSKDSLKNQHEQYSPMNKIITPLQRGRKIKR